MSQWHTTKAPLLRPSDQGGNYVQFELSLRRRCGRARRNIPRPRSLLDEPLPYDTLLLDR